jgi:hypothetical protein
MWPFNRGWPLNGGPLNRGSTVIAYHSWQPLVEETSTSLKMSSLFPSFWVSQTGLCTLLNLK